MGPRIERPTTTRFRDSKVSKSRCHKDKEDTTESHREYYRIKQQRYRERQRECEEVLENATRQLKNEIGQLKRLRDQLTFQVPRSLTVWIVATEYLRIIRRGIREGTNLDFLHAAMAPGVLIDTGSGVDALVRNWILFTQWFPDINIQLKQLKQVSEHSLIAFTTTSFTTSTAAMKGAFPHLFQAREANHCAQIAARLRDQHLTLQGSVRFDWDEENKRVIRLHHQVDMVSALVHILGNLEDVATLFNGAQMTPECVVRDNLGSVAFSCDTE